MTFNRPLGDGDEWAVDTAAVESKTLLHGHVNLKSRRGIIAAQSSWALCKKSDAWEAFNASAGASLCFAFKDLAA